MAEKSFATDVQLCNKHSAVTEAAVGEVQATNKAGRAALKRALHIVNANQFDAMGISNEHRPSKDSKHLTHDEKSRPQCQFAAASSKGTSSPMGAAHGMRLTALPPLWDRHNDVMMRLQRFFLGWNLMEYLDSSESVRLGDPNETSVFFIHEP